MDSFVASQWIDFTESISPQIPMEDYFEKEHAIHGRIVEFCDLPTESVESILTNVCVNKEAQLDLDLIKSTPIKVISPKYRKRTTRTEQITYDQVLTDAMKKLELCKKPLKTRGVLNKTIQESNTFKTPIMSITKSSRSVGYRNVPNKHVRSSPASRSAKSDKDVYTPENSNNVIVCKTKASTSSLFEQDHVDVKGDILKKMDVQVNNHEDEKKVKEEHSEEHEQNEEEIKIILHNKSKELIDDDNKEEENDVDAIVEKSIQHQTHKLRASVLTWQNGRRSLNKHRGSNRFVSLAEAVSRFQNDTPKRFRTRCNKNHVGTLRNASLKPSMQHRLKLTIPVSPALVSKNRTRAVTVLNKEEREKREMEEMKKHQIKANPIPLNVLRGPVHSVPKTIVKELTTSAIIAEKQLSSSAFMMHQSEKTVTSTSVWLKNPGISHHDKTSTKNIVTKVLVTDPTGIIVEREEIPYFGVPKDSTARNVTRIIPFSFEARNKDLQIKKEQRLKSLQETNKAKMEFHARPVPNFCKPLLTPPPVAKQQKEKRKPTIQQCPFSFEERDKNLLKKKELTKQMLEEDKCMRVFRANPAPVFKPVTVRGLSKERLSMKGKKENAVDKCDGQENEEPNVVSIDKTQENKCMRKIKKSACIVVDKQNTKDKGREENTAKLILPLELNTDKRARERREFDEKIKRKEMEEETKRQEDKRRQDENEKQMRAEQRKLAEVKARPMPTYKPLIIAKATKPLTEPQSPMLSNKYRSKQP